MKINLTNVYKAYKGLWVALDEKLQKVISSGKNAKEVYDAAVRQGNKTPTLFKVPKQNLPYFGAYSLE